jgi:hypothetical protein
MERQPVGPPRPPRPDGGPAQPATPPPGTPGLLGRLLDEVIEPVALPGLALRPARGSEPPGGGRPAPKETVGRADAEAPNGPRFRGPAPWLAPAKLDVDAVAEQVYRRLLRRQQLERERRGQI